MTIERIHSAPEFLQLKEDWNALLSQSASHVPFLRHEFQSQWWFNLGGGEWDSGDLSILLRRDSDHLMGDGDSRLTRVIHAMISSLMRSMRGGTG